MDSLQRSQIAQMRGNGMGFKKIADALGISVNTVKTYCRRKNIKPLAEETSKEQLLAQIQSTNCKFCGAEMLIFPGHREKKFCSDACRVKWWNAHENELQRKSMKEYVCPTCGKTFRAYSNRNRKYCSHPCYIRNRFNNDEDLDIVQG